MGFLGGLVASAIKRDRGVKDWGHMIEGNGGMLDRADSLVFAAPFSSTSFAMRGRDYYWTPCPTYSPGFDAKLFSDPRVPLFCDVARF